LNACEACAAAKAKQKNVPKESPHVPAKANNERIYLDIATIKAPSNVNVTKPNWCIMVDERTQLKFSDFFPTKNGMVEPTCAKLMKWKQAGMPVQYIRLDNAGENKLLKTSEVVIGNWASNLNSQPEILPQLLPIEDVL